MRTRLFPCRRSALTVGDGGVGEGEPGADGGSGHPGRPAVVQRSRGGDTTGNRRRTHEWVQQSLEQTASKASVTAG